MDDPTSSMIVERSENIFSRLFGRIYFISIFYLSYFIHLLQTPFRRNNDRIVDPIRPPKAIIDGLMENFEDGRLINADESVEETFIRLIKSKQYETAMRLAKKFDLEMDLIYKNMWENNEKSFQLIDECLSKITDQSWIMNQCIDCIPKQLHILRHLLQYGCHLINTSETENNVFIKTLSIHLNRLDLYEKILKSKYDNNDYIDHFDPDFFRQFRQQNPFQMAIEHAHRADIEALSVLFAQEYRTLAPHFFVILSNLPETLPPSNYKDLIELAISTLSSNDLFSNPNNDSDDFEKNFYTNDIHLMKFRTNQTIDEKYLNIWFEFRAENILDLTMLVDNSLELLRIGIDNHNLSSLENLFAELDLYSLFVYDSLPTTTTTTTIIMFEKFRQLSIDEKMNLLFNGKNGIILIRSLFEKFFEKITDYCRHKRLNVSRKELLRNFFLNIIRLDFGQCLKIFETYTMVNRTTEEIRRLKIIDDPCDLIELALDCIRSYDNVNDLDVAFKVMECLPERDQAHLLNVDDDDEWLERFNRINDEADEMAFHLSMVEFLCENNTPITVKELIEISSTSDVKQLSFVEKVINNFCKQHINNITDEWKEFFVNLKD
ncbi:Sec39-like protein, partial [Euroglyphus maynei]